MSITIKYLFENFGGGNCPVGGNCPKISEVVIARLPPLVPGLARTFWFRNTDLIEFKKFAKQYPFFAVSLNNAFAGLMRWYIQRTNFYLYPTVNVNAQLKITAVRPWNTLRQDIEPESVCLEKVKEIQVKSTQPNQHKLWSGTRQLTYVHLTGRGRNTKREKSVGYNLQIFFTILGYNTLLMKQEVGMIYDQHSGLYTVGVFEGTRQYN